MIDLSKIKKLCLEAGITLKKLSMETGISQTALTMAIHRNSTTLDTLDKIAKRFGISVGYFFDENDIMESIRMSFERFDKDLKLASNYITTTLQYHKHEFNYPMEVEAFCDIINTFPKEVIDMAEYAFKKLYEDPVYIFLTQFSPKQLIKMADDGVITQDTAVFTIYAKNKNIFEDQDIKIYIVPKTKSNYWYKMCKSIDRFRKKFK